MTYLVFFASGMAGLIYEVCWVRQFGNVFGNTVYSASLVTAVFMCGLGLGSWGAGGWADRRMLRPGAVRAMFRGYGAAELGVAAFGLGLGFAMPRLGGASIGASGYARDAAGWYELSLGASALRYLLATVLVAPPAVLMGATLTLIVRAALRDVSDAGWRIGALYGVNTAGAALGCYLCDALLVPRLGIFRTELCAVAANLFAGGGALFLARRGPDAAAAADPPPPDSPAAPDPARARRVLIAGCAALALSGFAALGMEIVWFRFLSATSGAYRFVFSLILTIILSGVWLGALIGGRLQKRFGRTLELFVAAQTLVAVSALALIAASRSGGGGAAGTVKATLALVALPSLFMGASFPLVNAFVHDARAAVGRRVGWLYLTNTLGGVAGSLFAGFVLTPLAGSQTSFAAFAVCAALAPFALAAAVRVAPPAQRLLAGAAGVTVIAAAAWLSLPADLLLRRCSALPPGAVLVDVREGPSEVVAVVEEDGTRALYTNGHPMSATTVLAQRYMRAFAHLPLLMTARPERALVICFGVGNTVHAATLHRSLARIEVADLSRNVLEHAPFFAATNHGALADPRVAVFVADGRQHLRMQPPDSYDLVTLEPPPIVFAGVSALYSREFYALVKSRLKPDGFMTQWLPAYQTTPEIALAMVRAFVDEFPRAALLSGSWGELILVGTRRAELGFDLDALAAALAARPEVAADLRTLSLVSLTEIAGTFLADGDALRAMTAGVAPISDDAPRMEYAFGGQFAAPEEFFAHTAGLPEFCRACFAGGHPDARVPFLPLYLEAERAVYAEPAFRANAGIQLDARPAWAPALRSSPYLAGTFRGALADTGRAAARRSFLAAFADAQAGRLADAARGYETGLALDPSDPDARYNLAAIYAALGRDDDAVAQAEAVLARDESHRQARAMLCALRHTHCP